MTTGASSTPAAGDGARIAELDGLRGAAALAIVIWHYVPSIAVAAPGTSLAYFNRAASLTWAGVDLFFVLSGYLIGSILLRAADSPRYFRTFYGRRAARIVPLYAVMLAGLALGNLAGLGAPEAAARPVFENNLPWWSYFAFAQNFFMVPADDFGPKFIHVTWSLAIEEQFYLLLPLLFRAVRGSFLAWILAGLALMAPVLRAFVPAGMATYVLLPFRMDSLMAGALLALLWSVPGWRARISAGPGLAIAWWVLALPVPVVLRSGAGLHALGGSFGWLVQTWLAIWFAVTLAALLAGKSWLGPIFRLSPLPQLGRVAYGVYLLHLPVLWVTHLGLLGAEPVLSDSKTLAVTLLAGAVSILLALVAYRWIEAPFLAWGKRLRY